jgi:hypothetical protein
MLTIHGTRRRLCDGTTRRELPQLGGLGLFGLSLAALPLAPPAAAQVRGSGAGSAEALRMIREQRERFEAARPREAFVWRPSLGLLSLPDTNWARRKPRLLSRDDGLSQLR